MTVATTTVRLAHRVRVRHASTGEGVAPLTARLDTLPYGWSVRVVGSDVVVSSRDGVRVPPAAPTLTVSVADPRDALMVTPSTVDVPLTSADVTVHLAPVPMTLTVTLVRPTGAPQTGRTVTARATSGANPRPSVALAETGPGVYRSGPTVWTAAFTPLELRVDGTLLRGLTVDLTRSETSVRLVDST